ncbi:transmembrane protein 100-like [Rhinoraja longicauda]
MIAEPVKEMPGLPVVPGLLQKGCDCPTATAQLVSRQSQLLAATGGAEMSCYRCTVPFALVVLIVGIVVTAVAYGFNSHGSVISVFGLVVMILGFLLVISSVVCWRVRQCRKQSKRRESQTALMANRELFV